MRTPNFSLEKFASANVKTLDASELNLIVGSMAPNTKCSNTKDNDGTSTNCSDSGDNDDVKTIRTITTIR